MSSVMKRRSVALEDAAPGEFDETVESTIAPEEVVVSDDVAEMAGESEENLEYAEGISEVSTDVEELEQAHENLSADLENEEIPAPTEAAMEMWQLSCSRIDRSLGGKGLVISALATESYTGSDAERRSNARFAMEAISDTLRQWWEKIKQMLKDLWNSIKAFWNKHISTLGRLKKALQSAKSKVKGKTGTPDSSKTIKAPSSLQTAIPKKGDIAAKDILDVVMRHAMAEKKAEMFVRKGVDALNAIASGAAKIKGNDENWKEKLRKDILLIVDSKDDDVVFASEAAPLVGGWYAKLNLEGDKPEDFRIEFQQDRIEKEFDKDREIKIGSKSDLDSLLEKCIALVDVTVKLGKDYETAEKAFDKNMKTINTAMEKADESVQADVKLAANAFRKVADYLPKVNQRIANLNVTVCKVALSFVSLSLANYSK